MEQHDKRYQRNVIARAFQRMNELLRMPARDLCELYDILFGLIQGTALKSFNVNEMIFRIIEFEFEVGWKDIFLSRYEMMIEVKPTLLENKFHCSLKLLGDEGIIFENDVDNPKKFFIYCRGLFPNASFSNILDEPQD